jgi:hypothetical protein
MPEARERTHVRSKRQGARNVRKIDEFKEIQAKAKTAKR